MKKQAMIPTITGFPFLLILLCILSFTNRTFANEGRSNWEEKLTVELNKIIPNSSFSFESITVEPSNKQVTGTGTFFKQPNITFVVAIGQTGDLASFTATMPSNAKIAVSNTDLSDLAGQSLTKLIPNVLGNTVYLEQFSFAFQQEKKELQNINLQFNALNNWEVLQGSTLKMKHIKVSFNIKNPTQKAQRHFKGILTGVTTIGDKPFNLTAELTENKEALVLKGNTGTIGFKSALTSIIGQSDIKGFSVPTVIFDMQLTDATLGITPYQKSATLDAVSNIGLVNIWAKKKEKKSKSDGNFDYLATISTHKDARLSKLHAKLAILDKVPLGGQKIVLSSAKKSKKDASKIPSMAQINSGIRKGCSLVAKLDISKLKLDHLLKVKELVISAPLTAQLDGIVLESALDFNIEMGPNATLEEVLFRLQPSPTDFGISLIGVMKTTIQKDILTFKGGMEIDLKSQALNFTALMDGSWNNPLGTKGFVMSDVGIQMGASFITPVILPNMALTGDLTMGSFKGAATLAFDTRNPTKSMLSANFNKVGLMDLILLVTDKKITNAIPKEMQKTLATINLQQVQLEIVPQAVVVLEKSYKAGFRAGGDINIAGFKGGTLLDIDYTNGIISKGSIDPINSGIFQLTGAKGHKKPSFLLDIRKGKKPNMGINGMVSVMGVKAETDIALLPNGFKFKLGGKLFNIFDGTISANGKNLSKAGEMGLAVKMNNDILNFIDKEATKFVSNSTEGAVQKLTAAQKELTKAQKAVKKWETDIKIERAKVSKKMAAKRKKYDKAKKNLTNAQKKVNGLNSKIKKLKKEKKKLKKHQVVQKGKINTQIVSLEGLKYTALGGLEAAKLAMSAFKGMNLNPDLHPKIVSMNGSKITAIGTLEGAKKTLDGVKWTLGFTGKVANYAIEKGVDAMINIKKVDFAGKLGAMSGGTVKLNTQLEWLGKKHTIKFNFNMKNPAESVKDLGEKLMSLKK